MPVISNYLNQWKTIPESWADIVVLSELNEKYTKSYAFFVFYAYIAYHKWAFFWSCMQTVSVIYLMNTDKEVYWNEKAETHWRYYRKGKRSPEELACIGLELRKSRCRVINHSSWHCDSIDGVKQEDRLFDIPGAVLNLPTWHFQHICCTFSKTVDLAVCITMYAVISWRRYRMRSCVKYCMERVSSLSRWNQPAARCVFYSEWKGHRRSSVWDILFETACSRFAVCLAAACTGGRRNHQKAQEYLLKQCRQLAQELVLCSTISRHLFEHGGS